MISLIWSDSKKTTSLLSRTFHYGGRGRTSGGNALEDREGVGTDGALYFQSNLSYHIEQNRTSPKGGEEL